MPPWRTKRHKQLLEIWIKSPVERPGFFIGLTVNYAGGFSALLAGKDLPLP